MLPKYLKMFTIMFVGCSFGVVYSQVPLTYNPSYSSSSQYVSYSGPGSSYFATSGTSASGVSTSYVSNGGFAVSSSGSLPPLSPVSSVQLQHTFPPISDPNIEVFAHSLTQVLLSSPVLNAIGDFVIDDASTLFYQIGIIISERDNVLDPSLAEFAANAGKYVGSINRKLYYNIITHMFGKLLLLNNLLTQENTLNYPSAVLSYVENYGIKHGISDPVSVLKAVANGVFDFATSIGINNIPNLVLAYQLFAQEVIALSSGVEI